LGSFNVGQNYSSLIKVNQSIKNFIRVRCTAYVTAKVNFIETQLNQNEKTNRIRVYLNNANLKYPIGLRLQGIEKPTYQRNLDKKTSTSN
jgi:Cu(I)/Ag(I) efflux system membrane fusion protein